MKEEIIQNINQGLEAAYINGNLASNLEYKPSFISNNPEEGKKVISSILFCHNRPCRFREQKKRYNGRIEFKE